MDPTDPTQFPHDNYDFKVLKELTTKDDISEFNKKAKSGAKNAFVIYFAHWCQHCKKLMPELIKLDKFLNENKDKLNGPVARISDEHIDEIEVFNKPEGFPTIVVLDGNGEKKKDFNGSRTMKGILTFLKNNGIYNGGSSMKGGKKTKKSKKNIKSRKYNKKSRKN